VHYLNRDLQKAADSGRLFAARIGIRIRILLSVLFTSQPESSIWRALSRTLELSTPLCDYHHSQHRRIER
jgi:hypothetical protein